MSGGSGRDPEVCPLQIGDITITDPAVIKRAVAAAAVGNVTEWYDFGVYATPAAGSEQEAREMVAAQE